MADKKIFFLDLINTCAKSEALESPSREICYFSIFTFYGFSQPSSSLDLVPAALKS